MSPPPFPGTSEADGAALRAMICFGTAMSQSATELEKKVYQALAYWQRYFATERDCCPPGHGAELMTATENHDWVCSFIAKVQGLDATLYPQAVCYRLLLLFRIVVCVWGLRSVCVCASWA